MGQEVAGDARPLFLHVLKDAAGQQYGQSHPMAEDARGQFQEGRPLVCKQGRAGQGTRLNGTLATSACLGYACVL